MDNVEVSAQSSTESAPLAAPEVSTESTITAPEAQQSSAPAESAPVAEKMIPQSQVNRIAAREAREAEAKVRAQYEKQLAQFQQQAQAPVQGQNLGGMTQLTEEQIGNLIMKKAHEMSQNQIANQIANDWKATMDAEKDRDPEFANLYEDLNIEAHPDVILWLSKMDNKAAVVRDIAQNPSKFANILMLARSGSPMLADRELQKLSASIKANAEAQSKAQVVAEPLSQIKSSNIGTDNGNMTVSDFRKMFRG